MAETGCCGTFQEQRLSHQPDDQASRLFKATVVGFVGLGILPLMMMCLEYLQHSKLAHLTFSCSGGRGHDGHRREGDD